MRTGVKARRVRNEGGRFAVELDRRARPRWPLSAGIGAALASAAWLVAGEGHPASATTEAPRVAAEPSTIDPPAPPGSTSPALAAEGATSVDQEHEILMSWLEPGDAGGRLRFARLSGQAWSEPVTVAEKVSTLGAADGPSLTVIDTQGGRRTLIARTGDVVARSADAGRTWSRLPAAALPFASFAGGEEGAYAFWLGADGKDGARLLGTRVLAGETLLDPRVSPGCATAAAMTWDGPVVVYRDRSANGASDVAIVRRQGGQWTRPRPVSAEGWRPTREPKSGPSVAAWRRQVVVAWYTEAPEGPRVLAAFSHDAGRTFGTPVEVDAGEGGHAPSGPVAVALEDAGHAVMLWVAGAGPEEATLNLARVSPDGKRGDALVLAKGPAGYLGRMPQIAGAGDRVAVTWLEGVLRRVRAAAVPLRGIPAAREWPRRPATAGKAPTPARPARAGEAALGLELISLEGAKVSLASLRGRAVLLNLWATWCAPCIQEMPELAALHERHGGKGLVVVGVNVDSADASAKVGAFASKHEVPFAVWLDPEMRIPRALRVPGLPATFVLDRRGNVVWRREGPITAGEPELKVALERALARP